MTHATRPLTPSDYAQARTVYGALPTGGTMPDFATAEAAFQRILSHPGTVVLGALQDTRIVSIATLHVLPNITYQARPYALIENVATLPDYKGMGFGKAVMQAVERFARDAGAYKIMLLTGQANKAAGFYEKLGYAADEKHGMILRLQAEKEA